MNDLFKNLMNGVLINKTSLCFEFFLLFDVKMTCFITIKFFN